MSPSRAEPGAFCVDCRATGAAFAHPAVGRSPRCREHRRQRELHMAQGRQIRFRRGQEWTDQARQAWADAYVPQPLEPDLRRGALLTRGDLEDILDAYLALGEAQEEAGNKFRRGDPNALRTGLSDLMDAVHEVRDVLKRIPGIAETRQARRGR